MLLGLQEIYSYGPRRQQTGIGSPELSEELMSMCCQTPTIESGS